LQLRDYWAVVRRRLPLVLLIPTITLFASAYVALRGPNAFCSNMKLAVSVLPDPTDTPNMYDRRYYSTLVAEYLADDLVEILKSPSVTVDVAAELGQSIEPGLIASATRAKKTHRTIDLAVCGQDVGALSEMGEAYARVIDNRLPEYFKQMQAPYARVTMINRPTISRANSLSGLASELALRTLLGLALGLGLAFLMSYLDDRVRDRQELERLLDLPTLAEIPAHSGVLVR
jgi:capsular polysaccharide biosynthesis protein